MESNHFLNLLSEISILSRDERMMISTLLIGLTRVDENVDFAGCIKCTLKQDGFNMDSFNKYKNEICHMTDILIAQHTAIQMDELYANSEDEPWWNK